MQTLRNCTDKAKLWFRQTLERMVYGTKLQPKNYHIINSCSICSKIYSALEGLQNTKERWLKSSETDFGWSFPS